MNTPPRSVGECPTAPEYFNNQIVQGLEKVLRQRAEATPEPSFADDTSDENYQYSCEHLRRHFDADQLKKIRERVNKPEYWEREANSYKDAAIARGWGMTDGKRPERTATPTMTNDWKKIARSYQYILHELGFSAEEIEDVRLRIESQTYWKIEEELLEHLSKLKERELIEQWRKEDEKKSCASVPARRRTFLLAPALSPACPHNAFSPWVIAVLSVTIFNLRPASQYTPLKMVENYDNFDLANVVLFLGSFTGVDDIVALSENKRYQFWPPVTCTRWKGRRPAEEPIGPFLCLKFEDHLFSPEGWVFGSLPDPDKCDLQLSKDNSTGISRRHFRIDTDPTTRFPRLTVLSASGTVRIVDQSRKLSLARDKSTEISRMVKIDLGAVSFLVWRPDLNQAEQRRYDGRALKWSREAVAAVPTYFPALNSQPETASSNIRYGKNNAVYVNLGGVEGRGMTASVMQVEERTSRRVYGAKEPYFKVSDDFGKVRSRLEGLKREFDNVVKLKHPHIVEVFELVMAEDKKLPPWLIMEYMPQSLQPKDLDEQSALAVLTQSSSALEYMHSQKITHRDVKPDNILIKNLRPIHVKLADFGTARQIARGHMDTFVGSPIYMAPEFLDRPLRYTNKVDMFSLGLVGLYCVSPWDPRSDEAWLYGPLSLHEHASWMHDVIVLQVDDAVVPFRRWLRSMLRKESRNRGSAEKSLKLLWEVQCSLQHEELNIENAEAPDAIEDIQAQGHHDGKSTLTKSNKRPASMLSDGGSGFRLRQKPPSQVDQPLPTDFQGKSDSPQPPNSSLIMPSSPYSAPTPHDDEQAPGESDESECESIEDLVGDWRGTNKPEDSR
ncbi:uncharacterized protein FTOL_05170 [Fusarium torulosum]|uniref:Autophagy-related protein 1 n=1 Tax=Fusarium torulosum TaxID=33205 RepID=A0AAE8M778_9HYPO|nr:uncharacterized protein FTOL_05170 [Fusarium torulosum]